jgi:Undecaprenyl-phosphate galactose phosphotransferase WbaP
VFISVYAVLGLYPGLGLGGVETLRRLSLGTLLSFAFLAAATFALKVPPRYSRITFGIAVALSLFSVPLFRLIMLSFVRKTRWWPKPVVLVIDSRRSERVGESLRRSAYSGYRTVGVLVARSENAPESVAGLPVLGSLDDAAAIAGRNIHTVIVETETDESPALLDRLRQHFRHVVTIRSYSEVPLERVQIRSLGELLGIEYTNNLLDPANRFAKRALDLAVGIPVLLLSLPLILLATGLVKLRSSGSGFFVQNRGGRGGQVFRMPKIRTMMVDAEELLERDLTLDPSLSSRWGKRFKLEEDPRIVPGVGTFLRRFSIDELPQLWSVLKGDMSLVGPRPLPEYHLAALSEDARRIREEVRPGITGLWQIRDRGTLDIAEQEARDTYYVRNWTIWLDLYVIGRTVGAVLSGKGAH